MLKKLLFEIVVQNQSFSCRNFLGSRAELKTNRKRDFARDFAWSEFKFSRNICKTSVIRSISCKERALYINYCILHLLPLVYKIALCVKADVRSFCVALTNQLPSNMFFFQGLPTRNFSCTSFS